MEILTSGHEAEVQAFLQEHGFNQKVASFGIDSGAVVGVCTYKVHADPAKMVELSLFVLEPYRARTLTKESSLIEAAFNALNAERDTTYIDSRGAVVKLTNEAISNEVVERFGFKYLHVGASGARIFERVFA